MVAAPRLSVPALSKPLGSPLRLLTTPISGGFLGSVELAWPLDSPMFCFTLPQKHLRNGPNHPLDMHQENHPFKQ